MARFYGWTHDYIDDLDHETVIRYYSAITVLDAQERLVDMNVSDYPKMGKESRKKFFKEMRKKAYPSELQKEVTFDEMARKLNGGRGRTSIRNKRGQQKD